MNEEAFYERVDEHRFESTVLTRGPWSLHHQHGGPPSALLARAVEAALDESMQVARVAVRLPRPVPVAPLEARVGPLEGGKNVKRVEAVGMSDGKVVCTLEALVLARAEIPMPEREPAPASAPGPLDSPESPFPFFGREPAYDKAMEVRFGRGTWGSGDVLAWMRMRVPLVRGETPSPLVRTLVAADSGSGVSQWLSTKEYSFVNPDLVLSFSRMPEGEWIGLEARTDVSAAGVGLADTRLVDGRGGFGRSTQSLLVRRVAP